jgi:hypothetical protein
MEVTKWLKPSLAGHELVTARVQAATRGNAEQASHDEGLVKGSHHGAKMFMESSGLSSWLAI